jgi:hypothetical protein
VSENCFLYQFCSLLGAATLVCGTHLFLLATWKWDSAKEAEPTTPEATISTGPSDRGRPVEPFTEVEIAPPPVYVGPASEEQVQVALEERLPLTAEARVGDQVRRTLVRADVSVEQPPISAEARVGDQTRPASASADVALEEQPPITADQIRPASASADVALEEQPPITAEARVGDQIRPASASADLSVALEEQPPITVEARVRNQTALVSASANVSAEPATKDNMADSASAPELQPSSSAETAEQGTEGGDKSDADTTPMQQNAAVPSDESQIWQHHLPETAQRHRLGLTDNNSVARRPPAL